ncbi:transcriptional regulator, MucR family [Sphingomonas laterariae]|uniref:Transcriptional regulator, MucR family n=1 Tax=Edaphosphingomonas laterariae TaxID=861865 RepID=A0A239G9J3_9SPHN|nr:MucR family transcriptional regulator [Sphingomonas laterariae]SNS65458.1 transcriptional regulator, MucR family [Sphingomonas laterariae]
MADDRNAALIELTADIVSAHLSNNNVAAGDVPVLIRSVHDALVKAAGGTGAAEAAQADKPVAMVGVRKSLSNPEHIVSLIDGKPYKSLKRHITRHGYTPESYREAFGLPATYPMVAPAYSERRRAVAKELGLGRKKGERPAAKPAPRTRGSKAAQ